MEIDNTLVKQAKEKLGDDNALWIAQLLHIENFDTRNLRSCCPFHAEDTPSFIYDKKRHTFHCFGCLKNVDIIDALIYNGLTYAQACQELFKRAGVQYNFGMLGVKALGRDYRYPKDVSQGDMSRAISYLQSRKISVHTIEAAGLRQDEHGNIVFRYMDDNDVLTMIKYRPSHEVKHGESKMWCQPGSDTKALLFNMNRINATAPLLICEGEIDCLSAIESGYANAVSVPLGAGNLHWIEENWEWLEKFENIILCGDNDKPGQQFMQDAAYRLGSWRTKFVDLPVTYENEYGDSFVNKDINDTLVHFGPEKVMECISKAKDVPVDSVTDFTDIDDIDIDEQDGLYVGIKDIDREISKLNYGTFNILSGINGCVDCCTQFFNGYRWKYISEYEVGDQVLIYHPDGSVSLECPDRYIAEPCDEMLQLNSFGINQVVTPDHTIAYRNPNGQLCMASAKDIQRQHKHDKGGFKGKFIQEFTVSYDGDATLTEEESRLIIIAIGFKERSVGLNLASGNVLISVPDYEKATHLLELLAKTNTPYKTSIYRGKNAIEFYPPHGISVVCHSLWRLSQQQYAAMYDELALWTNARSAKNRYWYVSRNRQEIDLVQFILSTQNVQTRLSVASVNDEYGYPMYMYNLIALGPQVQGKLTLEMPISTVRPADGQKYCFTVSTGMFVIRRMGIISVTGNSGKSSFLSQMICQCLEQGRDAWLYSMELPNAMAKNWIQHVFAGAHYLEEKHDERGRIYWNVPKNVKTLINDYYRGRLYIYKEGYANKPDDIMASMEASARKYGCKLFVLDNLTAVNLGSGGDDKWDKQNEFIIKLIDFARKYNVVVILVVHPRKLDMPRRLTKMDIQGSGGMVDLAHRAFSLYRVSPKDREGMKSYKGDGWRVPPEKHDVIFSVLKDRYTGCEGKEIGLYFHRPSMRFFTDAEEVNYCYSWDKKGIDKSQWIYPYQLTEEDTPF